MKVEETTDYKQFKKIKGNRGYAQRHLKNLIASIAQNNLLQYTTIIVNSQMEVIDGQHRLAAAQKLGLPIYYVVSGEGDLTDVIRINANLKSWGLMDYLESQILLGNKNYKIVADYIEKYHLPIGVSIKLLAGDKADTGANSGQNIRKFKEGIFEPSELANAQFVGEKVSEIAPHCEAGVWKDRAFIDALMVAYTKVKPSSMIDALVRSGVKVPKKAVKRDYLLFLEDIFNFRKSSGRQKFY